MTILIDNSTFLQAIFGESAPYAHVTSFPYDPGHIPEGEHLRAWAGGYAKNTQMREGENQYFTISIFAPDEEGRARRRKANFVATYVVVLDDVKEKLSEEEARRLPAPTYILETSNGSEQWGYKLATPATERHRVENLQDGLVASGLAPDGKDPGMKGVTRYVRLPEGSNTKASKALFGVPWRCQMKVWEPTRTVTLEQLAAPFGVELDAVRRESRVDGAATVDGHPLLRLVHIKEERSPGRYDITCPWVFEHTGAEDSGTAVITNADGSLGFKCHHGSCQERTGFHLLDFMERLHPGIRSDIATWKMERALAEMGAPIVSGQTTNVEVPAPIVSGQTANTNVGVEALRRLHPSSTEAKTLAAELLRSAEELPAIDKLNFHDGVRDVMGWSKTEFNTIIKELRSEWFTSGKAAKAFYDEVVFVKELNQFYHWRTRCFMTVEAFTNANLHEDSEARKGALQDGFTVKVDRLDYAPGSPRIFEERGIKYANMYMGLGGAHGRPGDCSAWLNHWELLGWGEWQKHMLQWMAYTLRHPENKINHMMILGSKEGCGKDFLLYPLIAAMGEDCRVVDGDALAENYTGYLNGVKYLHINEAELGTRAEALALANKLKPIAAAPPETLRVRELFTKPYHIRNVVNGTMTTNSRLPLRLQGSRRFFAIWSDLNVKARDGNMLPEWQKYWTDAWAWMKSGGAEFCIWYLQTQVDLSDFNPGTQPPVTDFLREIQEESKPPVQRTLECFVSDRIGAFDADLVTMKDALATLQAGELLAPELMYAERGYFSPKTVGNAMRDMGAEQVRGRRLQEELRLWCVRDKLKYLNMTQGQVFDAYTTERQRIQSGTTLRPV